MPEVTRQLVNNREAIEFHSDMAFGKIFQAISATVTVGASSTLDTSYSHDAPFVPNILGWVSVDGNYVPLTGLNDYTYNRLGYEIEIFPYCSSSTYGFYIENASGSSRTLTIKAWLYAI